MWTAEDLAGDKEAAISKAVIGLLTGNEAENRVLEDRPEDVPALPDDLSRGMLANAQAPLP